jgi:catechol 2,3-dioxygenase-like lactoylglutathione lyase family enzyme
MLSPIAPRIGAVFIPVSDIHAARDWYCRLLGLQPDGEVLFGHIYVLPMNGGSGLVLDSKDYAGPNDRKPLFHFATHDIVAARDFLARIGAAHEQIADGVFVRFEDPDGNLLMVADVPLAG